MVPKFGPKPERIGLFILQRSKSMVLKTRKVTIGDRKKNARIGTNKKACTLTNFEEENNKTIVGGAGTMPTNN